MSSMFRRLKSTSAISASTKQIAEQLLKKTKGSSVTRKQLLDANQLQRLSLALNRPKLYSDISVEDAPPAQGVPLPPGSHLIYFTPAALPRDLGLDGTDISFSPEKPFTRRMWAGGELRWDPKNRLAVGDEATETTKLLTADAKVTRTGEEMIVVGVEKTFENVKGIALVDRRDWVFRTQLLSRDPIPEHVLEQSRRTVNLPEPSDDDVKVRDFLQTPVSLFRFSALTFNAHMIHFSRPWCREVEGHREIVVHGPLNLINMLDFWRDSRGEEGEYDVPKSIKYRATAPIYAGEPYRGLLERGDEGAIHVKLWGSDGKGATKVGMMGDILSH